jgi:tetrahydromethanopterin S-methyltransferase subunit F
MQGDHDPELDNLGWGLIGFLCGCASAVLAVLILVALA